MHQITCAKLIVDTKIHPGCLLWIGGTIYPGISCPQIGGYLERVIADIKIQS